MLTRATAPERVSEPQTKATSIFETIGAFLPFHSRRKAAPAPVSEKSLSSHLPSTLDDLQAFTPLTHTSTSTLLPTHLPATDESSQSKHQVYMRNVQQSMDGYLVSIPYSATQSDTDPLYRPQLQSQDASRTLQLQCLGPSTAISHDHLHLSQRLLQVVLDKHHDCKQSPIASKKKPQHQYREFSTASSCSYLSLQFRILLLTLWKYWMSSIASGICHQS